jgi:tetratricopeptide (TPR) repeat protein
MRFLGTLALVGAVLAPAAAAAATAPPLASTTVIFGSNSSAVACSKHAKEAAATYMGMLAAIAPCTVAIGNEPLSRHQLAATYVNRGVILLNVDMAPDAAADFKRAMGVEPDMGEAYVNYGAALVAQRQDAAGLAEIDRGLALGANEPERAYFNRGVALENLNDLKGAYESYKRAAELKPDWTAPQTELARFTVSSR